MALERKLGKTVRLSLGIGLTTSLMGWASLSTQVETVTLVSSRSAWHMASELTSPWIPAARRCAASGEMICRMVMAQRRLLMAPNIRANMLREGNMVMVFTLGPMVQNMLVVGKPIASMALDNTLAWMAGPSRDTGEKRPWMDWASTLGQMVESMLANIEMTASMALAYSTGRMVGTGKVGGQTVTRMDMVSATTPWVSP
mmetsp:Transcript_15453/g.35299  ORF Transcript_15453/g.35299 Transcript_15453/m.35299 type:complete len:200 (+) Transcript_15453:356-955(+)